jgi:hypothetical protein
MWSERYVGGSIATGRVKCDGPEKKRYPGPTDLELGMRLTNPSHKVCLLRNF